MGVKYDKILGRLREGGDLSQLATKAELDLKADRTAIVGYGDDEVRLELADNTIFQCTAQCLSLLRIDLPAAPQVDFLCQVDFTSCPLDEKTGHSTEVDDNKGINWQGDDIDGSGMFVPAPDIRYVVMFYYDGIDMRGVVSGTTPLSVPEP